MIPPKLLAVAAALILAAGCADSVQESAPQHRRTPTPTITGWVPAAGSCHAKGTTPADTLPDPNCTPGATNPAVTQDTIKHTICVSGWTKTVRPPVAYTDALKRRQMVAYGFPLSTIRDHEEDHLISLELGGSPTDPKNLWPEPGRSPNPKDDVEYTLKRAVCDGTVQLSDAQKAIVEDWTMALASLNLKLQHYSGTGGTA